jgi:hypothetical protein
VAVRTQRLSKSEAAFPVTDRRDASTSRSANDLVGTLHRLPLLKAKVRLNPAYCRIEPGLILLTLTFLRFLTKAVGFLTLMEFT